jgi:hypothetical protein
VNFVPFLHFSPFEKKTDDKNNEAKDASLLAE